MENPEEILQCLEEFSKIKPKDIPRELEEYLCFVAKTGNPVYQWPVIKCLFRQKLINVISEFYETCPAIDIPPCLNVDLFNYNTMKTFILEKLDTFVAAPFTVQRICELLTTPRKQYNRIDKYMRALEKNILVVSTTEPVYRSTENGENNNQAIVNGLESDHLSSASSDDTPNINIEEMDDTPPPNWSPTTNRHHTTTITQAPQTPPHLHIDTVTTTASQDDEDSLEDQDETPPSTQSVATALLEPQDSTAAVVGAEAGAELLVGGVFGRGVDEEGGSSDEDEEEERLLLAGDGEKEEDDDEDQRNREPQQPTISPTAKSITTPPTTTASLPDSIIAPSTTTIIQQTNTELPAETDAVTTEASALTTAPTESNLADSNEEVAHLSAEIALGNEALLADGNRVLIVEGDGLVISKLVQDDVQREDSEAGDGEEIGRDVINNNMSDKVDIKPQENIENQTETIKKLPISEDTEVFTKNISTEAVAIISSEIIPDEATLLEIPSDVDINVKTDSEQVKTLAKTPENCETLDKETDIEKHDTSAIVKEAEKLEKEVTEMENIPDDKIIEKQPENIEKIDEVAANAEDVANLENNENNVEQDERMEIDDDTLPDILEATSASL